MFYVCSEVFQPGLKYLSDLLTPAQHANSYFAQNPCLKKILHSLIHNSTFLHTGSLV
jgi:hypothetical protein